MRVLYLAPNRPRLRCVCGEMMQPDNVTQIYSRAHPSCSGGCEGTLQLQLTLAQGMSLRRWTLIFRMNSFLNKELSVNWLFDAVGGK